MKQVDAMRLYNRAARFDIYEVVAHIWCGTPTPMPLFTVHNSRVNFTSLPPTFIDFYPSHVQTLIQATARVIYLEFLPSLRKYFKASMHTPCREESGIYL